MKNNLSAEYEASVSMRISESQIQWERYNAMLVVNTIVMGLIGLTSDDFKIPFFIKQILPIIGILLCFLWSQMTKRGFMWTRFWTEEARKIEDITKDDNLIKPFNDGLMHKSYNESFFNTQLSSQVIIGIFIILYLTIFIWNICPTICNI